MYCQNCGKEMSADARFCSACGASLGQRAVVADDATTFFIPNNSWALWAYYLGLASLICGIFAGIPAFVAGVKGVQFAKKNPQAKGAIHAWFGILAGGVMFLLNVALLILIISSN